MFLCQFFHKSVELLFYSCPAVSSDENAVLTNVNPHGLFYHFNRLIIFLRYYYICYFFLQPLILYSITSLFWLRQWFLYNYQNTNILFTMNIDYAIYPRKKRHFDFFIHLCSNLIKIIESETKNLWIIKHFDRCTCLHQLPAMTILEMHPLIWWHCKQLHVLAHLNP